MNERELLKKNLKRIKGNNFKLSEGEKVEDYLELMFKYLGDEDPELRDNLIYLAFAYWIEEYRYFTKKELTDLLLKVLSEDFIFYKIGEEGEDSVLRRSFSMLIINPILCVHLEENFLNKEVIIKTKEALLRYMKEEKDLRGYDEEKGWMHSLAHVSDGVGALTGCKEFDEDMKIEFMEVIKEKLFEGKYNLIENEDERIINYVYGDFIEEKTVSEKYIIDWIKSLEDVKTIEDGKRRYKAKKNVKNFIRSLYFRILHTEGSNKISDKLIEVEKSLNNYLN